MPEINFICPYCDKEQFLEIEGMDEFGEWIETCKYCNKRFSYTIQHSVDGFTNRLSEEELEKELSKEISNG